jgi:hypothetical protein
MCSAFGNLHSGVESCSLFLVWTVFIKYENSLSFSFTCRSIISTPTATLLAHNDSQQQQQACSEGSQPDSTHNNNIGVSAI